MTTRATLVSTGLKLVTVMALSVWIAALPVLGAIVAPVVFRGVPMPFSADAMTIVFQRFDRVAFAASIVLLGARAGHLVLLPPAQRPRAVLALLVAVLLGGLAIYQGMSVSPRIAALHEAGAIRGLGEAGRALDRIHTVASTVGKLELVLALGLLAMVLAPAHLSARSLLKGRDDDRPSPSGADSLD